MMRIIIVSMISCLCLLLASCNNQAITYSDLMQHRDLLEQKISQCEIKEEPFCDTVRRAALDYSVLENEQSFYPEKFGLRVMQAQQQLVTLSKELETAKKTHDPNKIKLATEAYQDQLTQLNIYYPLIARMMPE